MFLILYINIFLMHSDAAFEALKVMKTIAIDFIVYVHSKTEKISARGMIV